MLIWVLYECEDYKKVVDYMDKIPIKLITSETVVMFIRSLIEVHKLDKALELITTALRTENNDEAVANLNFLLGAVHRERRYYRASIEFLRKGLNVMLNLHGETPKPLIASIYGGLGLTYQSQGDYSSALEYHQKSLAMQLKIHGDSPHPDIATSYNNIGNFYQSQGDYSSAMGYYQKAIYLQLKIHGDSPHPDIATSYINIGNVYQSRDDYSSAMDYYRKILPNLPYFSPEFVANVSRLVILLRLLIRRLINDMVSTSPLHRNFISQY